MKKLFIVIIASFVLSVNLNAQIKDKAAILKVLKEQTVAWNKGDVEAFMKGYWQNDSLMFIGKSGITYGWQKTLTNYKTNYPDTTSMGKLDFTILEVKSLSPVNCFVVGKWHLARSIGDLSGHFTLLFKKIKGSWFIVADHSS
jgi:ketosteroid isomerase-like protein